VGIGTSSPDTPLTVSVADDTIATRFKGTNGIFRILPFETGLGVKVTALNGDESAFETLALQAEDFHFVTGTTERLRIDSSGFVGIGCTPDAWSGYSVLQIGTAGCLAASEDTTFVGANAYSSATGWKYVTTDEASLYQQQEGGHIWYGASSGSADAAISWAERMRIDSSGNLLVGTTSSDAKLHVGSNLTSIQAFRAFGNTTGDTSLTCGQFSKFDNNSTTSQVFVNFTMNNGGVAQGQINANGASQAAFGSWSDRRLKENITDLPSQLANITALRPVEFDYIESEGGGHQLGFIAQEVEEIYPDLVGERSDGMKTLSGLSKWDARLVKAIQEQQALIESLTARITALES
jgi:hypothetical protein